MEGGRLTGCDIAGVGLDGLLAVIARFDCVELSGVESHGVTVNPSNVVLIEF